MTSPANQTDRAPVPGVEIDDALAQRLQLAALRAKVGAELPRVRGQALPAQILPQQQRRQVAGAQPGDHQHGVAVTAGRRAQQRPQRERAGVFPRRGDAFEGHQMPAGWADGRMRSGVHRGCRARE